MILRQETDPMTQTTSETRSLHLRHQVAASRERVFQAFTDPAKLIQWWAGTEYTEPRGEIDLQVGGRYRWAMTASNGDEHVATGKFLEIDPPQKLVQTWQWEGDEEVTILTLRFHDIEAGTEIELLHEGFAEQDMADKHEEGWAGCLQRIGEVS
jgi:uncharacterized protein YndB with AHSA1/START domain